MKRELGLSVVVMAKVAGEATADHVAKYNEVVNPPVAATKDSLLVRGFYLMNNMPMHESAWFVRSFDADAIRQALPLVIGKPVLANHTMQIGAGLEGLPQARYFDAFVDGGPPTAPPGTTWLGALAAFPNDDLGRMLVGRIDLGIIGESSPTVDYDRIYCSVCGSDDLACDHVPGKLYDGRKCYAMMTDIGDVHEGSMVWAGQQRDTRYFLAAGKGQPDEVADSVKVLSAIRDARQAEPPYAAWDWYHTMTQ